jgi:uroporphyrinogen decarboxylase
MNSRERFLTALKHQEPDRVPVDLNSTATTGIAAIAYNVLKRHMGISSGETRIYDLYQQLAIVEPLILEAFGVDFLPLLRSPEGLNPARPAWKPWTLPDGSLASVPDGFNPRPDEQGDLLLEDSQGHVTHRMPQGGYYFDTVYYPLSEATSIAEIEAYRMPEISLDELAWMKSQARQLVESRDKVVVLRSKARILEVGQGLRGWERFMMDLLVEPKLADAILEKALEHHLANLEAMFTAVGDAIDVVMVADDLGSQNGPLLSPRLYRQKIKPYHRQMFEFIKQRTGRPIFLHCCGSIYPLIPDLIEIGVDILNPVQFTSRDMDAARLKREFGRDLLFWGGGADTQHVLPNGTPDEVRRHIRQQIEILAPQGGFVFNPVHNIQANVPPENILAMFEAALEYGHY